MRRPIVAGNWKMNGSKFLAESMAIALKTAIPHEIKPEVVIMPPVIYIPLLEQLLTGTLIQWGAQNLAQYAEGAYTGEIAASMLQEYNCRYVLVGHSERRQLFAEYDPALIEKIKQAVAVGLSPILCLGETLAERQSGATEAIIDQQLQALLDLAHGDLDQGTKILQNTQLAYEPVWAIGTGLAATPEEAQQVHSFIRQRLRAVDENLAASTRILYGGSVKPENAKELFAMPDIDGGLIGGASLNPKTFLEICLCFN